MQLTIDYIIDKQDGQIEGKPKTRADCANVPRPCPYVSCKYNLGVEIDITGWPRLTDAKKSCMLDLIEKNPDGMTLDNIAEILRISKKQVRAELREALSKLKRTELADE